MTYIAKFRKFELFFRTTKGASSCDPKKELEKIPRELATVQF